MMAAQVPTSALASAPASRAEAPTRTSAPYGQACINCVKAKCKCILIHRDGPGPGSGSGSSSGPENRTSVESSMSAICERCARLGRECKPSNSVRKRGVAGSRRVDRGSSSPGVSKSTSAAIRAASLEQKIEDLVAALKAQTSSTTARADPGSSTSSVPDWRSSNAITRTIATGPTVVTPASTVESVPSPLSAPVCGPAPGDSISPLQAEETLAFFRQHYLMFFPFIYLPSDMTAERLQRDRPYLFLNIRALCSRSPIEQAALNHRSREELARRVLVDLDPNIDTLLGTVCYLGWIMHLCFKPGTVTTIGMATTLVTVLRLDRPTHEEDPRMTHCFKTVGFAKINYSTVRTMEERRITLACYVGCISCASFMKCPAMRWTPHMEDSLKILAANPEWEGDKVLVLMVRIWRLAENIFQLQAEWVSDCDKHGNSKTPVTIYIKYFHQCLQTIKDELPASLKDNRLATTLIMQAEMLIAEISLSSRSHWEAHTDTRTRPPDVSRPIDIGHVEANFVALQASKASFEQFLTFELSDFVGFSFPVLLNLYRAAGVLYRLRMMDEPGWDGCAVTNSVELLPALDQLAERYSELLRVYGFLAETDGEGNECLSFFSKSMRTLSSTSAMWRAHFAQADALAKVNTDTSAGSADTGTLETESKVPPASVGVGLSPNVMSRVTYPAMPNFMLPEVFPMDFSMDDAWCNEIMSSWEPGLLRPY
ncbi:hypothetical protein F5B22DRAFT_590311 [Xylaria bambusicola]|uniref:uncharacterized protein n=1 Tax=Xylaria bambusicola TaxID=326684 RepID=UPI0020081F83|nr:uncharacterized protein F5B22DRAFT_590311 [Xylaria bambusicola]KAI0525522.1 hypothetical protein F5B22DRAFT_590311 [Xylaria bambusicola]